MCRAATAQNKAAVQPPAASAKASLLFRRVCALVVFAFVVDGSSAAAAPTLRTSGQRLLDRCGSPFVVRGVEQILGKELPPGNDWLGLVSEITESGANAVRILPGVKTLSVDDVDAVLTLIGDADMIAYLATLSDDGTWLARSDVRSMLARHAGYIIIDAYGEPQYDDIARFRSESVAAIREVRGLGYTVPLTVTANRFGRDLPSILEYGPEILAADPLLNIVFGWQAYWGRGGYYQDHYGLTLEQAVDAVTRAPFPIQLGLDHITDFPSETLDFGTLMTQAEAHGVGWLWWDWYNPYGNHNNLSRDGSARRLTATGLQVVRDHSASIQQTARRACRSEQPSIPAEPSAPWPEPSRTEFWIGINAGGGALPGFVADDPFSGANVTGGRQGRTSHSAIDRSRVASPAPPESLYQSARDGASTYRISGFDPGDQPIVQLHFAELEHTQTGSRRFDVVINDERVLVDFDIVERAGAARRALQENFATRANAEGEVVIRFEGGWAGEPSVSGIVVTEWPAAWR